VVVCSDVERESLQAYLPEEQVWVVPNGVDRQLFWPRGVAPVAKRLLFFGRLDYFPNRDAIEFFLEAIWPSIRQTHPAAEFHVAGAGADPRLRQLLAAAPGVVFNGRVDDLGALVETAAVVVVPLRSGGGTRLKILESLATGRPVVSTTVGAEGLDLRSERELVLADGATAFAEAVRALLDDPGRAKALGERGLQKVRACYDWDAIEDAFGARVLGLVKPRETTG